MGQTTAGTDDGVNESGRNYNVGAVGYGLNHNQQAAAARLWRWHKESLNGDTELGGPLPAPYNPWE
jgi:hypothetical protein